MFSERVQSRTQQRERTQGRIIAVADRLFRTQGFAATSIRQIAREADVSTGTVMSVGDKSSLLAAVFEASIRQMQVEQTSHREAVHASDAVSTPDRVTAIFRPFLEFLAHDEDLSREYAAVLVRGTHGTRIFTQMADELTDTIAREFESAGMSKAPAAAASRAVYFAYLGVLLSWAGSGSTVHSALQELSSVARLVMTTSTEDCP